MAETSGLVQRLTVGETFSCAWIGPKPTSTELLLITSDGSVAGAAFAGSLVDTLASALTNYRSVVAIHGNNDATITGLRIEPA
jgi:hypothetical protein